MDPADARRIASELHDGPVQELTVSRLRIELMRSRLQQPELVAELDELERSVAAACDRLRELIVGLNVH